MRLLPAILVILATTTWLNGHRGAVEAIGAWEVRGGSGQIAPGLWLAGLGILLMAAGTIWLLPEVVRWRRQDDDPAELVTVGPRQVAEVVAGIAGTFLGGVAGIAVALSVTGPTLVGTIALGAVFGGLAGAYAGSWLVRVAAEWLAARGGGPAAGPPPSGDDPPVAAVRAGPSSGHGPAARSGPPGRCGYHEPPMSRDHDLLLGTLAAVVAAVLFGMLGPLSRFGAEAGVGGVAFTAWRAVLGVAFLAVLVTARRAAASSFAAVRSLSGRGRAALATAAIMGVTLNVSMFTAFGLVPIALALMLFYLYPAGVVVVDLALGHERMTRSRLLALAFSFCGVALVLFGHSH